MLLIVFGAGASFDSAPSYGPDGLAERPPLANQLFEPRPRFADALEEFSECQALIPYLRHPQSDVGVEQLLQRYLEEAPGDPVRHRQLAAIRYYLRSILGTKLRDEWF